MKVWGHRGSRVPGPQNTPQAVRAALAAGADGCEIDVRRTVDGQLVCVHDPVIDSRPVILSTAAELARSGVPSFDDVLAAAAGGRLVIEVKNAPAEPDFSADALPARLVVAALEELIGPPNQATRDVLISSFDPHVCDVARDAGWPTGLLTPPWVGLAEGAAHAVDAGYQELHAHVSAFTAGRGLDAVAGVVAGWAQAPLHVVAWTVTTPVQAIALREAGLDAVICDDPAGVVAALAASPEGPLAPGGGNRSLSDLKATMSSKMWQIERARRRRATRRARP